MAQVFGYIAGYAIVFLAQLYSQTTSQTQVLLNFRPLGAKNLLSVQLIINCI
jgi:hypothetical protein